ncbi:MAG: chemotaxis protein CheD [Phycisphaerales bacterium]|nr:chemotaxis protein CheD [Phycisphaerales bacterium]
MKHIVGVADMKIASQPGDTIVTHALGSCLGITIHDASAGVGGMLHVMMPLSSTNPDKAKSNPYMFVDTGIPAFFREAYAAGAQKSRIVVTVAGGANVQNVGNDRFAIGKRNYTILKKILWKNGVMIAAEDVGGSHARTMYLEVCSGRVWLSTAGLSKELHEADNSSRLAV